jgi:molybdopterin molybdotransferase
MMAQLSDDCFDCFAFSGPLMPLAEMERLIAERVVAVTETETVVLAAARGRVVAADVTAPLDLPPFDNSAVDGSTATPSATAISRPIATRDSPFPAG